jgi:hypothetical protein
MSEDKVHDLFLASCRLAIGCTEVKGTNTIERLKATLDSYAKVIKQSEDERPSANDDKFDEKVLT